jgi:calcineurin-like phosphoesterase family protein
MNETLIENWNRKVSPIDTVYILGDFSSYDEDKTLEIIRSLNGNKIFILGNHDRTIKQSRAELKKFQILTVEDSGKKIVLFHYPMIEWDGFFRGNLHFYGHVHNKTPNSMPKNSYNLCVEMNDYEPKTLKEIIG